MTSLTARLSFEAMRYGLQLRNHMGMDCLWSRLYSFNRIPITTRIRNQWANDFTDGGPLDLPGPDSKSRHAASWSRVAESDQHWIHVERTAFRDRSRKARNQNGLLKLYVSPHISALREVLEIVIGEASRYGCAHIKFAATVESAARPDKIVVYTDNWAQTESVAAAIVEHTKGVEPHGVPFTAEPFGNGLISWAIDPSQPTPFGASSWRIWITQTIAGLLVEQDPAKSEPESISDVQQALEARYGVRTDTWTLNPSLRSSF